MFMDYRSTNLCIFCDDAFNANIWQQLRLESRKWVGQRKNIAVE